MESDDSENRLVAVTSKVSPDLRDRIDDAREEKESRSAAIRRLIRAGLEAQTDDTLWTRAVLAVGLAFLMLGSGSLGARGQYSIVVGLAVVLAAVTIAAPQVSAAGELLTDLLRR